jgi:uncharacterized glyoxalase superfamily protein PhnB
MQRYEFFSIFVPHNHMNMKQNLAQRNMWNIAGKAGLALGGLSAAYLLATQLTSQAGMSGMVTAALNTLLWIIKFGGCIWLMVYFMKKFAAENPEADNSATFRAGSAMALLSALVYAAFTFANVAFLFPDLFTEQMNTVMQQMTPMLDSNTTAEIERIAQNLPQLTFFSNLIYCTLYGTILSFILSRSIPGRDPFADYKPEDQ